MNNEERDGAIAELQRFANWAAGILANLSPALLHPAELEPQHATEEESNVRDEEENS